MDDILNSRFMRKARHALPLAVGILAFSGCAGSASTASHSSAAPAAARSAAGPGSQAETPTARAQMLIERANQAYALGHVAAPAGTNALELFLQARSDLPKNAVIEQAIADLFPSTVDAVRGALRSGEVAEAERILALLDLAVPGSLAARDFHVELEARRASTGSSRRVLGSDGARAPDRVSAHSNAG